MFSFAHHQNTNWVTIVVSASVNDYNIATELDAAGFDATLRNNVIVRIDSGVIIGATDRSGPALQTGVHNSQSRIFLDNRGRIQGAGGRGGQGGPGVSVANGLAGEQGGNAIRLDHKIFLDNASGEIWSGGGGGGGGAGDFDTCTADGETSTARAGGGGGGGGAGTTVGPAGAAGASSNCANTAGSPGTATGGGAGGVGCFDQEILSCTAEAQSYGGGAGGGPGLAGAAGLEDPQPFRPDGGPGGLAGEAVNMNGLKLEILGTKTLVSDLAFINQNQNFVELQSTGAGLPVVSNGDIFSIVVADDANNIGLYKVNDPTPTTSNIVVEKIDGSDPIDDAAAPGILVTGGDGDIRGFVG